MLKNTNTKQHILPPGKWNTCLFINKKPSVYIYIHTHTQAHTYCELSLIMMRLERRVHVFFTAHNAVKNSREKHLQGHYNHWSCFLKVNHGLCVRVLRQPKCIPHWWSESCSVLSDSLWPHGLYSSWNSPGQSTGMGSVQLLFRVRLFPTPWTTARQASLSITVS